MSKHTITACFDVKFPGTDPTETETARCVALITYAASGGYPEQGPTYACGGTPAEPVELDLIDAKMIDGDGIDLPRDMLIDHCQNWLDNEGYDQAVQEANTDNEVDF